jgi:hypothetical protein
MPESEAAVGKNRPSPTREHRSLISGNETSPERWRVSVANTECSLHQLAPYIGKLKSSIARELIESYSRTGDLVVDPFAGAGTIPLEALLAGRRVFAADVSPYGELLTSAKTSPPRTLNAALLEAERLLGDSSSSHPPDLRSVPRWVRRYFHPQTLKEALSFALTCRKQKSHFNLACLLGILHHQRPGFLSYPSSHLVPYLRDRKFSRQQFPQMYDYRPLRPRILAKINRAYKRVPASPKGTVEIVTASFKNLSLPTCIDGLITSPPYMNALDYGRDNRLRLWFLDPTAADRIDSQTPSSIEDFARLMSVLASKTQAVLRSRGYCVLVIGDVVSRSAVVHPARIAVDAFAAHAPSLSLISMVEDSIPDVRRARRDYRGVKRECVVVFRKKP